MTDPDRILRRYLERPTRRRLTRVVRVYHEFVWRVALRITRNREDAADICQEVFLKLLLEPPAPETVRSPRGWLAWRAIAQYTAARRREERRRLREQAVRERAQADGLAAEDVEALHDAVAGLPADLRAAVELRYLAGLSNHEVAEALGLSLRAVEDRLHRARESLERRLGGVLSGLALLEAGGLEGVEPAPPALLAALLFIARSGSALRAASQVAGLGGAALAKKMAAAACAARRACGSRPGLFQPRTMVHPSTS